MWLGECIANWTGPNTEGARINPPFFTDADWNPTIPRGNYIGFITWQDPGRQGPRCRARSRVDRKPARSR